MKCHSDENDFVYSDQLEDGLCIEPSDRRRFHDTLSGSTTDIFEDIAYRLRNSFVDGVQVKCTLCVPLLEWLSDNYSLMEPCRLGALRQRTTEHCRPI